MKTVLPHCYCFIKLYFLVLFELHQGEAMKQVAVPHAC